MYFYSPNNKENPFALPEAAASTDFDRILVIANPKSTNARSKRIRKSVARMQEEFGSRVHILETKKTPDETIETIHDTLREGDVLPIAGGDGTANIVVRSLLTYTGSKDIRRSPIFPLRGGDANDLAMQLNDARSHDDPVRALKRGRVLSFHPMEAQITSPDRASQKAIAAYIFSIGWTGATAQHFNQDTFRQSIDQRIARYASNKPDSLRGKAIRLGSQGIATIQTLKETMDSPFVILQDGEEREAHELLIANGDRTAKYGRFLMKLTEKGMVQVELNTMAHTAMTLGRFVTRTNIPGERRDHMTFTIHSDYMDEIPGQSDGEHLWIPSDSVVSLQHTESAVYALTTRQELGLAA